MIKPLLSICIPTYNRAHLLASALHSLVPQVRALGDNVELIVSDNCSTDNTANVVEAAQLGGPISYYRNERNLGAVANIMRLVNELANGEFAWIIGDDDLVRPDGVKRVIDVIKNHPEIDYVFVNTTCKIPEARMKFSKLLTGSDFPDLLPTKAKNLSDRYVEKWEELIDPEVDGVFLGSLMCSVFRLQLWRQYNLIVGISDSPNSSLEQTYPHAIILAHTMHLSKAYYIGYPCTINFFGQQEWIGYVPMIVTVRLQELLDLYQDIGVDRERIKKCRRYLLHCSGDALLKLLIHPSTPGREYFSLPLFLRKNRYHKAVLVKVFAVTIFRTAIKKVLPDPIYRTIRTIKHKIYALQKQR